MFENFFVIGQSKRLVENISKLEKQPEQINMNHALVPQVLPSH
jgi:hypothetical protein